MSVLKSQGSILMSDSFPATEVVESEPATEGSFLSVVNVIEKGHRLVNGRIFTFRESNHGFMISPEKTES